MNIVDKNEVLMSDYEMCAKESQILDIINGPYQVAENHTWAKTKCSKSESAALSIEGNFSIKSEDAQANSAGDAINREKLKNGQFTDLASATHENGSVNLRITDGGESQCNDDDEITADRKENYAKAKAIEKEIEGEIQHVMKELGHWGGFETEEEPTGDVFPYKENNRSKKINTDLSCERLGEPSDEIAAEMVYWRDIPSERNCKSPFYDERKYMTFKPDFGGWNNIRMAMETMFVMA